MREQSSKNIKAMFKVTTALALVLYAAAPSSSQNLRNVPLGFCAMSSMTSATSITTTSCALATFTGTGSGTALTASSVTGLVSIGDQISGTGVTTGTVITAQVSVSPPGAPLGGAGVYTTNNPTTSNSATITAGGVPQAATYAVLCAYTQAINYRDDGVAPTGTPGTGGQGIAAGSCIPYNGTFSALQFIQQSSGAILGLSLYK